MGHHKYDHNDDYEISVKFSEYCELRYKEIINNTPPEYHDCVKDSAKDLRDQFISEYNELISEEYYNNFSYNIENPNSWT